MRWKGERQSTNVEDRRGMSTGRKVIGGGIATLPVALIILLLGGDPQSFLQNLGGDSFTHGTSKQCETWFMTGFNSGDISKGEI
jgi:uncharacterized protein